MISAGSCNCARSSIGAHGGAGSRRGRSHCSKTPASRRHRRLPRPRSRRLVPLRWMYRADTGGAARRPGPCGTAHHVALGRVAASRRECPRSSAPATARLRDWMSNGTRPNRCAMPPIRALARVSARGDEARALVDGNARPAHARIPPRSISRRCSSRTARRAMPRPSSAVDGFENGALSRFVFIRRLIRHICLLTSGSAAPSG